MKENKKEEHPYTDAPLFLKNIPQLNAAVGCFPDGTITLMSRNFSVFIAGARRFDFFSS